MSSGSGNNNRCDLGKVADEIGRSVQPAWAAMRQSSTEVAGLTASTALSMVPIMPFQNFLKYSQVNQGQSLAEQYNYFKNNPKDLYRGTVPNFARRTLVFAGGSQIFGPLNQALTGYNPNVKGSKIDVDWLESFYNPELAAAASSVLIGGACSFVESLATLSPIKSIKLEMHELSRQLGPLGKEGFVQPLRSINITPHQNASLQLMVPGMQRNAIGWTSMALTTNLADLYNQKNPDSPISSGYKAALGFTLGFAGAPISIFYDQKMSLIWKGLSGSGSVPRDFADMTLRDFLIKLGKDGIKGENARMVGIRGIIMGLGIAFTQCGQFLARVGLFDLVPKRDANEKRIPGMDVVINAMPDTLAAEVTTSEEKTLKGKLLESLEKFIGSKEEGRLSAELSERRICTLSTLARYDENLAGIYSHYESTSKASSARITEIPDSGGEPSSPRDGGAPKKPAPKVPGSDAPEAPSADKKPSANLGDAKGNVANGGTPRPPR